MHTCTRVESERFSYAIQFGRRWAVSLCDTLSITSDAYYNPSIIGRCTYPADVEFFFSRLSFFAVSAANRNVIVRCYTRPRHARLSRTRRRRRRFFSSHLLPLSAFNWIMSVFIASLSPSARGKKSAQQHHRTKRVSARLQSVRLRDVGIHTTRVYWNRRAEKKRVTVIVYHIIITISYIMEYRRLNRCHIFCQFFTRIAIARHV